MSDPIAFSHDGEHACAQTCCAEQRSPRTAGEWREAHCDRVPALLRGAAARHEGRASQMRLPAANAGRQGLVPQRHLFRRDLERLGAPGAGWSPGTDISQLSGEAAGSSEIRFKTGSSCRFQHGECGSVRN